MVQGSRLPKFRSDSMCRWYWLLTKLETDPQPAWVEVNFVIGVLSNRVGCSDAVALSLIAEGQSVDEQGLPFVLVLAPSWTELSTGGTKILVGIEDILVPLPDRPELAYLT